eukprot:CAMPEP_0183711518 /NCGR_PEP_ID=MMETSP0737-20130205/7004_1 /TAXON_ID=385413 /ORGANISM="Thalassiosira miniscula, Strain CCMP1093" /LENGTH=781 /DNA_ID=CAMNT_0025940051 /DNA_START=88 /DNA_END=2430 /DNA_ORIENTATION=+
MASGYRPPHMSGAGGIGEAYPMDQSQSSQSIPGDNLRNIMNQPRQQQQQQQHHHGHSLDQSSTSYDTPRTSGDGGSAIGGPPRRNSMISEASSSQYYGYPAERRNSQTSQSRRGSMLSEASSSQYSAHPSSQSRRGSMFSEASGSQQPQPYFAPGERINRRSSAASSEYDESVVDYTHQYTQQYNQAISAAVAGTTNQSVYSASASRSIYEEAQSQSSSRFGGIMYHKGTSSSRRSTLEAAPPSTNDNVSSSNMSTMTPSGITNPVSSSTGTTPSGGIYHQPQVSQVRYTSPSGNLLVRVRIDEEPSLELDKDELRVFAHGVDSNEHTENIHESHFRNLHNDASTIFTSRSAAVSLDDSLRSGKTLIVNGTPKHSYAILDDDGPTTELEHDKLRMKQFLFSPSFRRSLFLGICFVLLGLGLFLTLENVTSVKRASDWVEPHRDNDLLHRGGGIDWTFGSDAPKPFAGATIDQSVEYHIADWAHGTSRVPPAASIDGFGSVALSETVMFKDVPFFWGVPFAGGNTLEMIFGQCLTLVQASNKGIVEDGEGTRNELQLATVPVMGRTYLNVDLSTVEGIQRASALALGTSGMADIVYSPLLHEASELFSTMNQGRLFVLVRHPLEREFARFRWLLRNEKLPQNKRKMSYLEFASSPYVVDNWMTRSLVRKEQDEFLTAKDMHNAKELLRRKALVGLHSDTHGAARHFARHFGWDHARSGGKLNEGALSCFERAILDGMATDMKGGEDHLVAKEAVEGSVASRKIMEKNRFDFELFAYSQQLYK